MSSDTDNVISDSIARRVTSYNLPKNLQFEYAKVPTAISVSREMRDENGTLVSENG
jgi:hypothetical protein